MSVRWAKISLLRRSAEIEGERSRRAKNGLMPVWPTTIVTRPRIARLPRLRRPSLAVVVWLLVVAALGSVGWVWLRDSSLVAVERVTISGATGLGAPAARSALTSEAQQMTTLNVDSAALSGAVARFPLIRSLSITTDFPHAMKIVVHERTPVGALVAPGGTVAVADDGVLLAGVPTAGLPVVELSRLISGRRVTGGVAAEQVALLASAPSALRRDITQVTAGPDGLTAFLRAGPQLRFGDASRLAAKWVAAERVLRDPEAAGAAYIDVSIPERPASGSATAAAVVATE